MMKKLLILGFILAMASAASAGTAWFEVNAGDSPPYKPSDTITIDLVSDVKVSSVYIDAIASNAGTAHDPRSLNTALSILPMLGTIVNSGGILIQGPIQGSAPFDFTTHVPPGQAIYSFEFHVPDVPWSTYITICTSGSGEVTDFDLGTTVQIDPLTIHVVPEPMTIALLGLGGLFLRRRR
jgi:hypothetical protein